MPRRPSSFLTSATLLLLAAALPAEQTDNHGIHAVPPPGPVAIDGDLADWDLSGSILVCYDVRTFVDVYSARISVMHDADNLYLAIRWKDPLPIGNSHDPQFQANKGWAGDSVQLRLKTDRITHVTAWCYAKRNEPTINLDWGKSLDEPFGGGSKQLFRTSGWKLDDGAEMAFKADADGKGYVQELKLPWKLITLTGKPPADQLACGVELLWGEADWPVHRYADNLVEGKTSREFFWTAKDSWGPVWLEKAGKLKPAPQPWELPLPGARPAEGPVAISYSLAAPGRVTLAIDDAQGRRVRNLLAAVERPAGAQTERWDCLDDQGKLVPAGSYTVKGLTHAGLHTTYAGSFASPANPPWSTADGRGGYYGDHTAATAAAFGPKVEQGGALACPMGEAGQHLIGVDANGQRRWGLANRMFAVSDRIALATDGTTLWIASSEGKGRFFIWRCELATGTYSPWKRVDADGRQVLDLMITEKDGGAQCRAIALRDGVLAVVLAADRRVRLLDAATGDVRKDLDGLPAGISSATWRADGQLLLTTADGALLTVDPKDGTQRTLASGLSDPQGVAVGADGRIYVSQRGPAQDIAVLTAEGRQLAPIGRPGGRPATGRFDADGMLQPAQIALDAQGRLWVPETTQQPKRTSVWDVTSGKLAFDLVGTTAYAAGGQLDPYDSGIAYSEEVEYRRGADGKWHPSFTLPDALGTGFGWIARLAKVDGREYMQVRSTARDAPMVKLLVRTADGGWRPCGEFGNAGLGKTIDEPYHRDWNRKFTGPLWEGRFGKAFCWIDGNDDGVAQRDEIETDDEPFRAVYWGQAMGEDLRVTIPGQNGSLRTFRPRGFTAGGTPRYLLAAGTTTPVELPVQGEGMIFAGADGRTYLNQTPLCAVDSAGKVLWTYPSDYVSVHGSHNAPAARSGLLIGPSSFYGTYQTPVGEVFLLNGNLGQNFIFTADGLWVQALFNDCRGWGDVPATATIGMPTDAMSAGGESFGGWFGGHGDGKCYLLGGGTSAVIHQVSGLDGLRRFGASATVAAGDLTAAEALIQRRAAETAQSQAARIARTATPPQPGKIEGWDLARGAVTISGGGGEVGTAKAMRDDTTLYVAWQVKDPSPLKNAGKDERLMFITGDCVDLMLRTGSATGDEAAAGDLRLLVTLIDGKPMAMLYRPVAPGAPATEAADFSSPARTFHFQSVKRLDIPLALTPVNGGYTVTAAVPLAALGLDGKSARDLRGDFGILLSDSAGQETTSRNYWTNKTANNTNDIPDEVRLSPAQWGKLTLDE